MLLVHPAGQEADSVLYLVDLEWMAWTSAWAFVPWTVRSPTKLENLPLWELHVSPSPVLLCIGHPWICVVWPLQHALPFWQPVAIRKWNPATP